MFLFLVLFLILFYRGYYGAIILIWFMLIYTYSWRYAGYWYCGHVYIHVIDWFVEEVWKARKGRLQWTWRWRWAPSLPLYLTMSFSIWSMENCSAFTSKFEVLCITAHNLAWCGSPYQNTPSPIFSKLLCAYLPFQIWYLLLIIIDLL